jgi:hypothetical protein
LVCFFRILPGVCLDFFRFLSGNPDPYVFRPPGSGSVSHRGEQGQRSSLFFVRILPGVFLDFSLPCWRSRLFFVRILPGVCLDFFRCLSGIPTRIRIDLASVMGIRICIRIRRIRMFLCHPDPGSVSHRGEQGARVALVLSGFVFE